MLAQGGELLLIGRRDMRWQQLFMHNLPVAGEGPGDLCTLQVSRTDAQRIGLVSGGRARVSSRVASLMAPDRSDGRPDARCRQPAAGWGHDVAETASVGREGRTRA